MCRVPSKVPKVDYKCLDWLHIVYSSGSVGGIKCDQKIIGWSLFCKCIREQAGIELGLNQAEEVCLELREAFIRNPQ